MSGYDLLWLGIAVAAVVGVLWNSRREYYERELHNARWERDRAKEPTT